LPKNINQVIRRHKCRILALNEQTHSRNDEG
jgi:hypothetical protein